MPSLADRYLRTLESNNAENKSPLTSPSKAQAKSPAKSPLKPLNTTKSSPVKPSVKSPVKEVVSPIKVATPTKTATKVDTKDKYSPVKSSPLKQTADMTSLKSAVKSLNIGTSSSDRPDRRPALHNENLTPSEIKWDAERENWQAYEYLCHVQEAKEWLEGVLGEKLPDAPQLPQSLVDGVTLATVTKHFRPDLVTRPIFTHKRLQYRHIENITYFMDMLEDLKIPDLFTFDVTDLYEKRNLPKVIYCIHALSHFLAGEAPAIDDLVGKVQFTDDQLTSTQKGLDAAGAAMPNFGAAKRHFSGKQEAMPPVETAPEPVEIKSEPEPEPDAIPVRELSPRSMKMRLDADTESESDSEREISPRRSRRRRDSRENSRRRRSPERRSYRDYSDHATDYLDSDTEYAPRRSYVGSTSHRSYADRYHDHSETPRRSYLDSNTEYSPRRHDFSYDDDLPMPRYSRRILTPIHRDLQTAEMMLMELEALEPDTIKFQAICRGFAVRKALRIATKKLSDDSWVTNLQSAYRGNCVRKRVQSDRHALADSVSDVLVLQSVARGHLLRQSLTIQTDVPEVFAVKLQSLCRGSLVRKSVSLSQRKTATVTQLQALARGSLARRRVNTTKSELQAEIGSIAGLQSAFRGLMVRFRLGCLYDDLDQEYVSIIAMQVHFRAALVRRKFNATRNSWNANTQHIITLQAVWRAKAQKTAYRALMAEKNPSLQSLRGFLPLINDSASDYHDAVKLDELKELVAEKVRNNERLENLIAQLDTKIALLVKNKISLDEVALMKNAEQPPPSTGNSLKTTDFDIKSLSKASRERVEHYQGLFYLLQTHSGYLSRFLAVAPSRVQNNRGHLDTAQLVLSVFGGAQSPREEYFLLRLLGRTVSDYGLGSGASATTQKLFTLLNRRPATLNAIKQLVGPGIGRVKAVKQLDLESSPVAIYRSLGLPDAAAQTSESAIQHPLVRQQFVHNLQQLRELTSGFVHALIESSNTIPFHVQYLARQAFEGAWRRTQSKQEALVSVGQVVISHFVVPALVNADSMELVDGALDGHTAKNLVTIARILRQIGLMAPFSPSQAEEMFLQPLNEFVASSAQNLTALFAKLIAEADEIDAHYGFSTMDDVTRRDRPSLSIDTDYMLAVHSVCFHELNKLAPDQHDALLRPVLEQLGSLPRDARDILDLARFDRITLELNASYGHQANGEDDTLNAGGNGLLATVKRCLIYVLRIQAKGNTILEVLVAPVQHEHEHAYNLMLSQNNEAEAAGELANLTFRELKLLTLEKVIELESSGAISREDGYQTLLNSIAGDIRDKDHLRHVRARELASAKAGLAGLTEKTEYLQTRLKTYTSYIEQAMATLQETAHQNNKRKSRSHIPFGPGSGSSDYAKYGSYRATGDKLMEKGILLRLRGYSAKQLKDIHITISCNAVAKFDVDVGYKGALLPGGSAQLTLDELLNKQYNATEYIELSNEVVRFSTNGLLKLVFRKFYGADV